MPTYGYQCTQCQHKFDVFQKMSDDPLSVCPECSGAVKRLLYPVGVVFKGSGWYITDSRKPEKNGDSAKPETKSETKSEAKSGDSPAASDTSSKSDTPATTTAASS